MWIQFIFFYNSQSDSFEQILYLKSNLYKTERGIHIIYGRLNEKEESIKGTENAYSM